MKNRIPGYCLHRASGQAVTRINGRDVYLGVYGEPESKAEYDRVIMEYLASKRSPVIHECKSSRTTIMEVLAKYHAWAKNRWSKPGDGSQLHRVLSTINEVIRLYGEMPVSEFRGKTMFALRDSFMQHGWSLTYVNHRISVIRQAWKWMASRELIPAELALAVEAVPRVKFQEYQQGSRPEVEPVSVDDVGKTLPHLPSVVADMVLVQLIAGMRPGEVVRLRAEAIVRREEGCAVYTPKHHKTAYLGHERNVLLDQDAMAVLTPYLEKYPAGYLFRPVDELKERIAKIRKRDTDKAIEDTRKKRRLGEHWLVTSYARAIARACKKAEVPHWHPHQLRHTAATKFGNEYGPLVAKALLGHRSMQMTERYIKSDLESAIAAIREKEKERRESS